MVTLEGIEPSASKLAHPVLTTAPQGLERQMGDWVSVRVVVASRWLAPPAPKNQETLGSLGGCVKLGTISKVAGIIFWWLEVSG